MNNDAMFNTVAPRASITQSSFFFTGVYNATRSWIKYAESLYDWTWLACPAGRPILYVYYSTLCPMMVYPYHMCNTSNTLCPSCTAEWPVSLCSEHMFTQKVFKWHLTTEYCGGRVTGFRSSCEKRHSLTFIELWVVGSNISTSWSELICPIAITYSMGQIIKSVCVCQCICPSASTLTVAFLDRFSPKLAQT